MQTWVIFVIMCSFFVRRAHTDLPSEIEKKAQRACSPSHSSPRGASGGWSEAPNPEHLLLQVCSHCNLHLLVTPPGKFSQAAMRASSSKSLSDSRQGGHPASLLDFFLDSGDISGPDNCRLDGFAMRRQCSSSAAELKHETELGSSCDASRSFGSGRLPSLVSGGNV